MIETHFNVFDCVVIGILALSCIIAFFRGLVREILSLVGLIGSAAVTVYYYAPVYEKMQGYFKSTAVAAGASAIGLYITALIGFAIVNILIIKTIRQGGEKGMLDNTLGLVFGALRGSFIISLGFFLLTIALPEKEYPLWIKESMTHPYAEKGAIILTRLAPDYMSEASNLQKKAIAQARERMEDQQDDDGTGYSRNSNRDMDRLIDSTGGPSR